MPKKPEVNAGLDAGRIDPDIDVDPPRRIRRRLALSPETIAIVMDISRKTQLSPDEVVKVALYVASDADESVVSGYAAEVIARRAHLMAESVGAAFK